MIEINQIRFKIKTKTKTTKSAKFTQIYFKIGPKKIWIWTLTIPTTQMINHHSYHQLRQVKLN